MIPRIPLLDVVLVTVHPSLSVFPPRFSEGKVRPEEGPYDSPSEYGDRISAYQFPHKRHRAVLQHAYDVLTHQIEVLLPHVRHLVLYFAGIVDYYEGGFFLLGFLVELVVLMDAVEFLEKGLIGSPRKTTKKIVKNLTFIFFLI